MAAGDRSRWDYYFNMQLVEFLNSVAFSLDKWNGRQQRLTAEAHRGMDAYTAAVLNELLH